MNRREFLLAAAAVPLAGLVPLRGTSSMLGISRRFMQGLTFHPDAFSLAMAPLSRLDMIFGWAEPQRITLDQIRSYGPPSRVPA